MSVKISKRAKSGFVRGRRVLVARRGQRAWSLMRNHFQRRLDAIVAREIEHDLMYGRRS